MLTLAPGALTDFTWKHSTTRTLVNVWPAVLLPTAKLAEALQPSARAAQLDTRWSLPSVFQIKVSDLL